MGKNTYSHAQNLMKSFYITLKNSSNEHVENAEVFIDGIQLDYDSLQKKYFTNGEFKRDFTVKALCKGYDTLNYKSEEIPYSLKSNEVSIYLYLVRPGDKYYYYDKLLKWPYKPRQNELLVVLKPKEIVVTENCIAEFENNIKKQGLIIHKTFFDPPPTNTKEYMKYSSLSPSIQKQVIVKKQDGSVFDANSCAELAFLRELEQVNYAGPLIMIEDSYLGAITYNHFVKLDYPLKSLNITTLNNLLKEIDESYYFDEKNNRIVLPPETNENIPQIMEKIYAKGVHEILYMSVMRFVRKG